MPPATRPSRRGPARRRPAPAVLVLLALLGVLAAPPSLAAAQTTTTTPTTTATTPATPPEDAEETPVPPPPGDPVIAAVGDIACSPEDPGFNGGAGVPGLCQQRATSELVMRGGYTAALVLGDLQYEHGRMEEFEASYVPTWGRLQEITRPVVGNHEYFDGGGEAYFDLFNGPGAFGGPAGDRDKGFYSFDVGSWHVVVLNSVCSRAGGCGPGSPQEQWLRADLAANPAQCTLAAWHHPPLTSSGPGWPSMGALQRALHEAGAEVLLTGHAHNYERFAPVDPSGRVDPAQGIRQFVAGMGGKNLSAHSRPLAQSEARDATRFGVLALTLRPGSYDWRFVPATEGTFEDAGTGTCHGPPPPRAPSASTGPVRIAGRTVAVARAGVDAGGQPATVRFEYGTTRALGRSTPEQPVAAAPGGVQQVSAPLPGLVRGRRFYVRVVATNASGIAAGARRRFLFGSRAAYEREVLRTPGLRSYWRLDDPGGTLTYDDWGGRIGVAAGARWGLTPGALVGDRNPAAAFDGDRGSAIVDGPSVSTDATLEGWFRWRAGGTLLRDDSAAGGWHLGSESRGRLAYRVGGRTYATDRPIDAVRDGAWHHLALTKAGGVVQLFVDGRRVHLATDAPSTPATAPWHVMRNGPLGQFAAGAADEVALYDRSLAPAEVARHYARGVAGGAPRTGVRGPSGPTNDPTPSFALRSNERGIALRCALAPGGTPLVYRPCGARRGFGRLADGTYAFAAYAIDAGGHPDPTPRVRSFTVDTVRPELVVTPPAAPLDEVLRRGLRTPVACSEACTVEGRVSVGRDVAKRLRLRARGRGRVIVGTGTARVTPGPGTTLVVRFDRRARAALRRRSSVRVRLEVTARDAAGNGRRTRLALAPADAPAPPAP